MWVSEGLPTPRVAGSEEGSSQEPPTSQAQIFFAVMSQHLGGVSTTPQLLNIELLRLSHWMSFILFLFSLLESESEVAQSCPTLCNPVDRSLPDSSLYGILQARILEWVAISFSRGST